MKSDYMFDMGAESNDKALAYALKNVSTLTELWLGPFTTEYYEGDEHDILIPDVLPIIKYCRYLYYNLGCICDEEAKALANALAVNSTLRKLELLDVDITAEGMKAFADALTKNNTLQELNLKRNSIRHAGEPLANTLKMNTPLKVLVLEDCDIDTEGLEALASAMKQNCILAKLTLSLNDIDDELAIPFADALKINCSLTELDLNGNHIGDEGAEALAWALMENSTLTNLCLRCNKIGDEGAKALALLALMENATLTQLDLSDNEIGDKGTDTIAWILETKRNTTLTSLCLRDNEIGDWGAEALALALTENATLTELDLRNNQIGDEGTDELLWALETNTNLTELNVGREQNQLITAEGAKAFCVALAFNRTLTKTDLISEHGIGMEAKWTLRFFLHLNKRGRNALQSTTPASVWKDVADGSTDVLYWLLREKAGFLSTKVNDA